jgi:hypothetical protein
VVVSTGWRCWFTPRTYPKAGRHVKEGETCTFSGSCMVAYAKAGTFVYATLTGPITLRFGRVHT